MAEPLPVEKMLQAFQDYYELKYSTKMAEEIRQWFGGMGVEYARELYQEVKRTHESKYRSLPDIAVLNKATLNIRSPEQMRSPEQALESPERKQLTDAPADQETALDYFAEIKQMFARLAESKRVNSE